MNFLKIIKFIKGYVTICIKGCDSAAFLNFLFRYGITTWNIKKTDVIIYADIFVKDYLILFELRHLFNGKVSVQIFSRHGLFRCKKRIKQRKGLFIGFILFFSIIIFLSRFVWQIDVKGNEKIKTIDVVSAYTELGLYIGIPKNKVDTYALRDKLPLIMRDVSWCSFNLEGSKLTVNITELTENKKPSNGYSNIVAKTDGIVTKVNIISGNAMVKVGDVVSEGDILVSGAPELNTQKFVDSDGLIEAKTYKTIRISVPKEIYTENILSRKTKRTILEFFNFKIPLYIDKVHFKNKSSIKKTNTALFSKSLPIWKYEREFYEIFLEKKILSNEEISDTATSMLLNNLKITNVNYVEILEISRKESENSVNFTYKLLCREDICEKAEIKVSL